MTQEFITSWAGRIGALPRIGARSEYLLCSSGSLTAQLTHSYRHRFRHRTVPKMTNKSYWGFSVSISWIVRGGRRATNPIERKRIQVCSLCYFFSRFPISITSWNQLSFPLGNSRWRLTRYPGLRLHKLGRVITHTS